MAVLLVALTACSPPKAKEPLRVGFNPWPGYEFLYLAKAKGFYEKAGLEVKLVELNTLGDVRRAFERGQIDVMASTLVEAAIATENTGKKLKIVAVVDASDGADMMIARKPISSVAELAGKKVGMEGVTVDVLNAYFALQSAKLTLKDVQVVTRTQDDLMIELESGRIDAMQTYPPYSIKLLQNEQYQKIFDSSKIAGKVIDVISVDATVLAERADEIKALVHSYFAAMEDFQANRQVDAHLMGSRSGGNAESYLAGLDGLKLIARNEQINYLKANGQLQQSLQATGMALQTAGVLKKPVDVNAFMSEQALEFYP
ncbi:ABC transporter substrate-binding protein [Chitinibacter bivalviorum]|uniref:ABC transporter substrate-binding protein n=1 Tax=Chitinibacter bivalviorum TaxID=2739434 RepID=A0A7H9BEJ5_9NEIS|nr:ABC transporter substrate-binding protein [Chitinibacter bivalviorum]QLG87153.1 ABC transporter substrate-binding protein [Chitinibacter bivalviorum]